MPLSTRLLLRRALLHRRGRLAAALAGLTISAALVTALLTLYADLGQKLNRSFSAFGPNVVLSTRDGAALPAGIQQQIDAIAREPVDTLESGAVVATANGTAVPVIGTDLELLAKLHPSWQLTEISSPRRAVAAAGPDASPASSLASAVVGRRFYATAGSAKEIALALNGRNVSVFPAQVLSSGGPEDAQIYIPATAFTQWAGVPMTTLEAHIPGSAGQVDAVIAQLHAAMPELDVRPVRELVEGQQHIVSRTHGLMIAATAIIIATIAIAILATLSTMVLDRRRDYAVMKALGCPAARLHKLFLLEAGTLALLGACAGLVIGLAAAFALAEINFHTRLAVHWQVLPAPLVVNLLIAALAAYWPLRSLSALEPAALLRGE